MNVFEYDDDEMALRTRLEDDLGDFAPRVVPMEAILAEGRGIRHRRRRARSLGAASVAVFALAAGVLGQAQVGPAVPPSGRTDTSASPVKHTVKTDSRGQDEAGGFIGSGTVDGVAWSVAYQNGSGIFLDHLGPGSPGAAATETSTHVSPDVEPPLSDPLSKIMSVEQDFGNPDNTFAFYMARVPKTVDRLILALDDGETVTVPAVVPSVPTTSNPALYVAFVLPKGLGIREVTVYPDSGAALGESIPFNGSGFPVIVSWYPRGHNPPGTAAGSGSATGSFDGSAWQFSAWAGPFGICETFAMLPDYPGGANCIKMVVPSVQSVDYQSMQVSPGGALVAYSPVNEAVNKVVLTFSDGATVTPKLLVIGAIKYYIGVYPPGTEVTRITDYDAQGHVLAQSHG